MGPLFQQVKFDGPLGLLIAVILLFTAIVTALKGGQWLYQNIGTKLIARVNRARVAQCEREMLAFWQDFFNHRKWLVLILNEKKELIYISTELARIWNTLPHLVEGQRWRRMHKESMLDGYLYKLRESYESQSPFTHPVVIQPNGHELHFLARGEPYVSKGEVRYVVITMERSDNVLAIAPKQLDAGHI